MVTGPGFQRARSKSTSRFALRLRLAQRICVRVSLVLSACGRTSRCCSSENWNGPFVLKDVQAAQGAPHGDASGCPRGRHHRVEPWYVPGPFWSFFMHASYKTLFLASWHGLASRSFLQVVAMLARSALLSRLSRYRHPAQGPRNFTFFFDRGMRTGSHVIKASQCVRRASSGVSLKVTCDVIVVVGCSIMYGLALGGAARRR